MADSISQVFLISCEEDFEGVSKRTKGPKWRSRDVQKLLKLKSISCKDFQGLYVDTFWYEIDHRIKNIDDKFRGKMESTGQSNCYGAISIHLHRKV